STPQDETTAAEVSAPENNAENTPSPSPLPAADIAPAPSKSLPPKFLIDIPFYSQAPLGKWDAFHEEMCEEASILNAGLYLENKTLTKDQFEADLQKMQKIEKDSVGEWKSTTVAQTKKWAGVYFGDNLSIKIIDNPTVADIEAEVAAGHPVVVPLAGQDIGNQNFTPPGPVYHMLVVKGYDAVNFITNDVGTRKGNSYTYQKEVIMKNMHDWNAKNIHLGAKKVLVLYR
ncbi:MAG TPA: C39 family peptidase, partial [Candidatus Bathyarchaeia archaeon]|nr:C39 family peptidase [Candidatus Bathyarchaeia archaeon]